VVNAQKPMPPIEKGSAGTGVLAHVAVSKLATSSVVPVRKGFTQRQGVAVSRKTHVRLDCGGAPELVRPLFERMKEQVLGPSPANGRHDRWRFLDPALPRTRTGGDLTMSG